MLFRFFEFILFQVSWNIIKLTGVKFLSILNTASTIVSSAVYISGALLLTGYMIYRYITIPNKTFAFPITGRLLSIFHINNPDAFPRLFSSVLKRYSRRWIEKFPNIPITKIKLYRKQPQIEQFHIESIYAVIFEIAPSINLLLKTQPSLNEKYQTFLDTMSRLWSSKDIQEFKDLGIDRSFSDVYKKEPRGENFMKDWFFISKIIDDEDSEALILNMKIMLNEPHWILYKKTT